MGTQGVRCEICDVELPSASSLPVHNEGKKHQKKLERRNMLEAISERSVFVCGVPKKTFSSWEQVEELFSQFGPVDKVRIDVTKGTYAIIEFTEKASADRALNAATVKIGEHIATIKKRKMDYDSHLVRKYEKTTIDLEYIAEEVCKMDGTFANQIELLARLFCLDGQQIEERLAYCREITGALRHYFTDEPFVFIFGSTATSIGTKDSDIDATLLFGEEPLESGYKPTELDRNKYTLMTCSADILKNHKIRPTELCHLTPADRIRFMGKILNDVRRCGLAPISDLFLVLDARCPLLRFTYKRNCTVDLTVDNRVGIAKTTWVAELINADSSCTLRRFMIAVRFWAVYHNLMGKQATANTHLNAYILNILSICFFQSKQLIPPLQRGSSSVTVGKWEVDFAVHPLNLQHCNLSLMIKEFFIWFVLQKTKDLVFCPRLGNILTLKEFHEAFPALGTEGFKTSQMNVQDPIELVHNISQLMSEKDLAAMRRAMVFSLSSLKKKPDSYSSILLFEERHNTSHDCDFQIILPLKRYGHVQPTETVRQILTELLYFDEVVEPEVKRSRVVDGNDQTVTFEINFPVWLGRRRKKRSISKQNPTLNTWELEKSVSKLIMEEVPIAGYVKVLLRLTVCQKPDALLLSFERLSDDDLQFHDVVHFLSQFLPNFSPYFSDENSTL